MKGEGEAKERERARRERRGRLGGVVREKEANTCEQIMDVDTTRYHCGL